jgi:hypothetical protein
VKFLLLILHFFLFLASIMGVLNEKRCKVYKLCNGVREG